ncbi:cleavage and polyadenylation specificity factor subunit 1, partial [Tanacetum coccineum]
QAFNDVLLKDNPDTSLKLSSTYPNLIMASSKVLEVFTLLVSSSGAVLELTCSMRLYDGVEFVRVLPSMSLIKTDKIIVVYDRARISVFQFDNSVDTLVICKFIDTRTSIVLVKPPMLHSNMMSYSARRPLVRVDPKGRCATIVIYGVIIKLLKVADEGVYVTPSRSANNMKYLTSDSEALLYTLHDRDAPDVGLILCAFGVSATLELKLLTSPLSDVPHDAYKLLAVPAPYGGFIVVCSNNLIYCKFGARCCQLDLNNLGMIDFYTVQRLEVHPSTTDAFLTSATTLGENFFFLGSRLERKLKQLHWKNGENMFEYKDIDRDSLMTIGPLKDFFYLKEKTTDSDSSSYGLVCCSGHGKNGVLYKLHFSVRPTVLSPMHTIEDCTGLWTLYDNTSLGEAEHSQNHAYMIISYESYTQVVRLDRVFLENVEIKTYPRRTINAANLFGRRGAILVQSHVYMIFTDDVDNYKEAPGPISTATVLDNYVLFLMNDGHIHLLCGGDAYNM